MGMNDFLILGGVFLLMAWVRAVVWAVRSARDAERRAG